MTDLGDTNWISKSLTIDANYIKTLKLSISRQAFPVSRQQVNATRTSLREPLRMVSNRNLEEKIDTEHDDSSPEGVEMRARWLAKEARSILEKRSN